MIERLTLLCDLNIICPCPHCATFGDKISNICGALEIGDLQTVNDHDSVVGLTITTQGRVQLMPPLPWCSA